MRTTLYLSAALAAMSFNLGASAASLAPTELNQETALAQTYLDADKGIGKYKPSPLVGIPEDIGELADMMRRGSSLIDDYPETIREAVIEILRENNKGEGQPITNVRKL